jgi:hypothetical protein
MAILPNYAYTLADLRTAMDNAGNIGDFINMLSQQNEILDDLLWMECNNVTSHKTTVLTGLPQAFFRMYNAGVPRSKSTRVAIQDSCAMLEVYSEVDRDLAGLNSNSAAWRLQEDSAFVDGMSQQMATQLIYGNAAQTPAGFTGLAPRFNTVNTSTAQSANNVLDGGGTGSTNTSIWICCWAPTTGHGIFPRGSQGGLQVQDATTAAPIADTNGNLYQALRTHFKWDCGMTIRDWRYFARIANIDVTLLSGGSAANIVALLIAAVNKFPAMPRGVTTVQGATRAAGMPITPMRPVIYCNRTVRTALELQIMNKSNALLQLQEYDGMTVLTFRGIPIRTVDAILNTEARVV